MKIRFCATLLVAASAQFLPAAPAHERTAPPPGIRIADADRTRLESGASALGTELDALRAQAKSDARVGELLPDVEVFHKAVDWALRYDEFFRSNEVALADNLLRLGTARAKQLAEGRPAWLASTGLVVRGYRSKIDGSVQPYGLVVPSSFASNTNRPRRLDVWLHGRDDKLTELKFISDRLRSYGEFTPLDTLVLHPYGRFCNAFKFAGETDVFEALEHAQKFYPVDTNRLGLRGFSMGGAGTWHLGAHHPSRWAAVNPGAGFVDVKNYQKLGGKLGEIPWCEQKLWNLYDPLACPINFINSTLVAYSGEIDAQKAAADLMEAALLKEGVKMTHIIGPKTGHKYEPEAKKIVARLVDEAASKGIEHQPKRVTLVTHSLKWNQAHWLTIDALDKHWDEARVEAEVLAKDSGNELVVKTRNVAALSFNIVPADLVGRGAKVVVDGQDLGFQNMVGSLPPPGSDAPASWWNYSVTKSARKWSVRNDYGRSTALRKRHDLQGPLDDAFTDGFLVVRPARHSLNEKVGDWLEAELARFTNEWRAQFRGELRIVEAGEQILNRAAEEERHLILWGDPSSNPVLAKLLPKLPLHWVAKEVRLGTNRFDAATHVPVLIYPNPLNPSCYIVLNSGPTFLDFGAASNAQQTPKLPDFAVIDITVPRAERLTRGVVLAGFFDEQWQLPAGPGALSR